MIRRAQSKIIFIIFLAFIAFFSVILSCKIGTIHFTFKEVLKGLFIRDDSLESLIIFKIRLPRIIIGGMVGICLSLSGCILQGVMRNHLASPTTIGVTSGASFVGYLTLVAFPAYAYLLSIGSIIGALATTLLIYLLAYQKGVSPVKMILAGLAVSAVFSAFNDIIKTLYSDRVGNATSFLVGGLNGVTWDKIWLILPYATVGIIFCILMPAKMNILMLGDETANSLGLRTELFRFILIIISSLLAGSAIAVGGLISFVGLIVPHIARLIIGSDYKYLFPTSILLGFIFVIVADTIGRVILDVGEVPVSIIISFVGAPFFLFLLKWRNKK